MTSYLFIFLCLIPIYCSSQVTLGVDRVFTEYSSLLKSKHIGLIVNHTSINGEMESTIDLFKKNAATYHYTLTALFAPEHGLYGRQYASEKVENSHDPDKIPIYSLHGATRRPTPSMFKGIDLLIYDIQDIGSRSYTYISTLFYIMEEAAKQNIPIIVLDRPNPINGIMVDGPGLEEKWRSIVGYINVPYCHGMTVGELANYFNSEYKIHCALTIIPMKGWKRTMTFSDTGLYWIPTSPNIPESTTPLYYPITGMIGELQLVNIGIGYTLPFKIIGAPWINAQNFSDYLNLKKFPGVVFKPFYFRPFFGRFAKEDCEGVLITVTNPVIYQPVNIQYLLISSLKTLYPEQFAKSLKESQSRVEMFHKVNGSDKVYQIIKNEKYILWPLKELFLKETQEFLVSRKKYLLY
jgi:uncharacterized protein YbbC (DUF1343 family)